MKRKVYILVLLLGVILLSGCSNNKLKDISYSELKQKLDNNDSFILEVVQTGCSACQDFTPRFKDILKEYNITAYSLNLTNLNSTDKKEYSALSNVNSTPTVIFFNKGEEESVAYRIIGAVDNAKIKEKLKAQGYIK